MPALAEEVMHDMPRLAKRSIISALVFFFPTLGVSHAAAIFEQENLSSSVAALAPVVDANLKNPWGITRSATGPFWISNQITRTSTIHQGTGAQNALVVTIPSLP